MSDGWMAYMIVREGVLHLPVPPDLAIHFFTPRGQEIWRPGWRPDYLRQRHGELRPGSDFVVDNGEGCCAYRVEEVDLQGGRLRYSWAAPASDVGTMDVRCEPAGDDGTSVLLRFDLMALTPEGLEALHTFHEPAFTAGMAHWEHLIHLELRNLTRAFRRSFFTPRFEALHL